MYFITSLDMKILESLYAMRDLTTVVKAFIGVSEAGGTLFVFGLVLCIGLVLALRRKHAYLTGLLASVLGAAGATFILKEFIARARPDILYRAYTETGFSFPSGHAALAAAFYGFCIYLVWRLIPSPLWRAVIITCLGILIAAIASSRLYLGLHYLSDVIGGLALGAVFVWIGIVVVWRLEELSIR